jgi:hypothetical protein
MSDEALEAAPDTPPVEREPLDRKLLAEANLYSVPYKAFLEMSPGERAAVKMRWNKRLRDEARRRRIDPDEFLALDEEAREAVRKEHPEQKTGKKRPRTVEDVIAVHTERADHQRPVADMVDEELSGAEPYSAGGDVPATEGDPKKRDRATLGEIRPAQNEDLLGWVQPRNLRDVYARYSIGDGQHFIRVERIEPKVFQQINCAGFLGEIREQVSEEQFHAMYGGRVYVLQVYGPDTRGRTDPTTGLPLIKPKTEPFRYTVGLLPPNLAALPGARARRGDNMQSNVHAMFGPIPTTAADAQIHKSTLDFVSHTLQREQEASRELRKELSGRGAVGADALRVVEDANSRALDATQRAAENRETMFLDTIKELREDLRKREEELRVLRSETPRESPVKDTVELMRVANPAQSIEQQMMRQQAQHNDEVTRLKDSHKEAMDGLRQAHREQIEAMRNRQDDETKRLRERADENERAYRDKLLEFETRGRAREQELKDEAERIRRDERSVAETRLKEAKEQFETRISDVRAQHDRDVKMLEAQYTTRSETAKHTLDFQISTQKERIKTLENELSEARAEAAEANDPVAVMEKQQAIAEKMGYKKEDDSAPQTAGERFAAMAGMGLSKALEDIKEWGPKVAEALSQRPPGQAMGGPPVRGQLPPGQRRPQRPMNAGQRPTGRGVAWATAHSMPISGEQPTIPAEAPPVAVAHEAPPPPAPAAAPPQAPPPVQASPGPEPMGPNTLSDIFPEQAVREFKFEVERAIDGGLSAEEFARRFVGVYPDLALMLVRQHQSGELIELVQKSFQNGAESPILRRDGRRWVEKLWESIPEAYRKLAESAQAGQQAPSEEPAGPS